MTGLAAVDIESAFSDALENGIERFPPLIVHGLLADAGEQVVDAALRQDRTTGSIDVERVYVPKAGSDKRPVILMGVESLSLYHAYGMRTLRSLERSAQSRLRNYGRGADRADQFYGFKPEHVKDYVINFDIASCYEYVDHALLNSVLYETVADFALVDGLATFIRRLMRRPVGLPQLNPVSDLLAEQYLQRLEDKLVRAGYETRRFVDDFRIRVQGWANVTRAIETFSESTRELHLVPAAHKTKPIGYEAWHKADQAELAEFARVTAGTQPAQFDSFDIDEDYGEEEGVPGGEVDEGIEPMVRRIVESWAVAPEASQLGHRLLSRAITHLLQSNDLVGQGVVSQILFHFPLRINSIATHMNRQLTVQTPSRRDELQQLLEVVRASVNTRPSVYGYLWLLWIMRRFSAAGVPLDEPSLALTRGLANSPSELVRAEAAWTASTLGVGLTESEILSLYQRGSTRTAPLFAALALQAALPERIVAGLAHDSALNFAAQARFISISSNGP